MTWSVIFILISGALLFLSFPFMYYRFYLLLKIRKNNINVSNSIFSTLSKNSFLFFSMGALPYFFKDENLLIESEIDIVKRHNQALKLFLILFCNAILFLVLGILFS